MTLDQSRRWQSSIFIAAIAALIFTPLFLTEVYAGTNATSDFPTHAQWALDIKNGNPVPPYVMAHSAWQFLLLAFNIFLGFSIQHAELISILLCVAFAAGILGWWFWPAFSKANISLWQAVGIVLGISIAAPVSLLWFKDHAFYLGYVGIVSYHNPTIILLRPLALLQFIYALRGFTLPPPSKAEIFVAILLSLLSTFAKPNFAICLLPAIALIALFKIFRKETAHLTFLIFGFIAPTAMVLAWQFLMTYRGGDSSHVIFSAFGVMSTYSGYLLPKFLLSILFPLAVAILYWKQASHNLQLILAWLVFAFGSFFTYFLAESGPRFKDGNFTWSGEIALFVLFAVSTIFFLDIQKPSRICRLTAEALWFLQVAAGVIYYIFFTLHLLYIV
ncbi:MAG: hypothetical protein M1282_16995 [Chloroflexi bacterium]|nr:hypothetical protein [Chloroflexota bacterium]